MRLLILACACACACACTHPPAAPTPARIVIPTTLQKAEDVLGGTWTGRTMTTFAAMLDMHGLWRGNPFQVMGETEMRGLPG